MKVLWFSPTPSLYENKTWGHNGGGWITSLETLIRDQAGIQLGIAFEHKDNVFRTERNGTIYYPINMLTKKINIFLKKIDIDIEEKIMIPYYLKIIDDFNPDVIQIFGSEWSFGLVAQYIDIPIIIHMQGNSTAIYNARFPVGFGKYDFVFNNIVSPKKIIGQLLNDRGFWKRTKREERILKYCHYYIGRTDWDESITQLYNPASIYYHCDEALRDVFINSEKNWQLHNRDKLILISVISSPLYKGMDLVLKAAKLLKENTSFNFEWRICGIKNITIQEKKTKTRAENVGVKLLGIVSAEDLKEELLNADIFVHPSYIDNSPNCVCEAQIVGMPVIATNVGGVSSIIEHGKTGLLFPANDPFMLCSYIKLLQDKSIASSLGKNARERAIKRHNPNTILENLLNIYNSIIK
jgi:glycosyltransferase involved in cell wall biosynthesis